MPGHGMACRGRILLCPHPSPHPPAALLPELAALPPSLTHFPTQLANEGWGRRSAFPDTSKLSWPWLGRHFCKRRVGAAL